MNPMTLIAEAVFARCLSALKDERVDASKVLPGPKATFRGKQQNLITDLRQAVIDRLLVPKGLKANLENVMIVGGGIEGLNLVSQLYIEPGDVPVEE